MGSKRYGLLLALAWVAIGCGGSAPPHAGLNSAQAAIRAADEVGASETPRASLHLKYARDQYALAQRLVEKDENERAAMVLRRAESDAELAMALARETVAENDAKSTADEVRALREQLEGE